MLALTKFSALSIVFVGALTINLWAQSSPVSQVSGTVHDPSGAAIPDAKVTITNVDTAATRTDTTTPEGDYNFTNLVAGPYKLQVVREGFSTFTQSGIVLQVNSNPRIPVTLEIGSVTQQVEVQANASMVETQSTGVGQVIDQKSVVDLPLNGRNATQLITLSGASVSGTPVGGTTLGTPGGLVQTLDYPTVAAFSLAGGQPNTTNYFLDGANHMDVRTNLGLPLPYPDALREFKVETNSLPANYGALSGGAVSAVTRSGTNQFHGGAFEFIRNGAVNARNYFATARDTLKRNQFGGQIGGPIIKDKLFFFGGAQITTERTSPPSTIAFVPTAAVLAGDFRAILSTPCRATAQTLSSSIANNNVLLPGKQNAVAMKFLTYLPVATDPCGKITYSIPSSNNEIQVVGRIDWQRSAKDLISGRIFVADYALKAQNVPGNILTAATTGLSDRVTAVNLGDTYVLTPNIVNSFRFLYTRSAVRRTAPSGVPTFSQLGSNVTTPIPNFLGQLNVSGYFAQSANPGFIYTNSSGVNEDLNWSLHNHQIGLGFSFIHASENGLSAFQQNPGFTFDGTLTGNALADFMTGNVGSMQQGNGQIGDDHVNTPSVYVQDNWKITSKFQINGGLRWDPYIPQKQMRGYASNFSQAAFVAGTRSKVFVNAPAGITYPGDAGFNGVSDTLPHYYQFAPRVGFVYDPRGKGQEVFRGGYGLFYSGTFLWQSIQVSVNGPWGNTVRLTGITAANGGLTNPWQSYGGGNPFPTPAPSANIIFPLGATYTFEPQNLSPPNTQQYNFAFQKQFGSNWSLSATYLGNRTIHQWLAQELNPAVYIAGNGNCGTFTTPNNAPCSSTTTTQARRRFTALNPTSGPSMASTSQFNDTFTSNYNGLLINGNHRFSRDFSILANYTWSHCLNYGENNQNIANAFQNPDNPSVEYGNCALDRRNIFNVSAVGSTPKFKSRLLSALASEWTGSLIYTFSSGAWANVLSGTDVSLTAVGSDRPNVTGNPNSGGARAPRQWFNTAAFSTPTTGTYGNSRRNTILAPSVWNVDMGTWKSFSIEKGLKLETRFEAFNVFNHTRFAPPIVTRNSASFGQIQTAADPRILQGALKLVF